MIFLTSLYSGVLLIQRKQFHRGIRFKEFALISDHTIPSFGQSLGLLLDSGKKMPTRGVNVPKIAKAQESVTDGWIVG